MYNNSKLFIHLLFKSCNLIGFLYIYSLVLRFQHFRSSSPASVVLLLAVHRLHYQMGVLAAYMTVDCAVHEQ